MSDQTNGAQWTKVEIYTATPGVEPVGALLLEIGAGGYEVRDAADFEAFLEGKAGHWDYIDESLLARRDEETTLIIYLAEGAQGAEQLAALRSGLARLRELDEDKVWGRLECALTDVREEDWAEAWKRYYTPMQVTPRLAICPSWEEYVPQGGEAVLRLDPGMAFGSGTHESTQLCLQLLDGCLRPGDRVLDIGCGSGILAISALLLGASEAVGVDIDAVAVRVAQENAALNGVGERSAFHCGSLAQKVTGSYDILFTNIVADVILSFLPDVSRLLAPGGFLIASGIIDTREQDVLDGVSAHGLRVVRRFEAGGWVGLLAGLEEPAAHL